MASQFPVHFIQSFFSNNDFLFLCFFFFFFFTSSMPFHSHFFFFSHFQLFYSKSCELWAVSAKKFMMIFTTKNNWLEYGWFGSRQWCFVWKWLELMWTIWAMSKGIDRTGCCWTIQYSICVCIQNDELQSSISSMP